MDTYPMPAHGWTCFHCGETFTTPGSARLHFGMDPTYDPACRIKLGAERGLLRALRKAEDEIRDLQNAIAHENTEAARAYHSQQTRHREQLLLAEEAGYERGLRDGIAEIGPALLGHLKFAVKLLRPFGRTAQVQAMEAAIATAETGKAPA